MEKHKKYLKPTQFAELEILKAIVYKKWSVGQKIAPERELAETLGITRPTLREVLQRLSRDGWITITHGKPTIVNDYKNEGGLAILNSLINFNELASSKLVEDWLEFRVIMFPELAYKAILSNSTEIIDFLNNMPDTESTSKEFAKYDWNLQMLLIKLSNNSIAKMIYNDLSDLYQEHCNMYFDSELAKSKSLSYYIDLKQAIKDNKESTKAIIKATMVESAALWSKL